MGQADGMAEGHRGVRGAQCVGHLRITDTNGCWSCGTPSRSLVPLDGAQIYFVGYEEPSKYLDRLNALEPVGFDEAVDVRSGELKALCGGGDIPVEFFEDLIQKAPLKATGCAVKAKAFLIIVPRTVFWEKMQGLKDWGLSARSMDEAS